MPSVNINSMNMNKSPGRSPSRSCSCLTESCLRHEERQNAAKLQGKGEQVEAEVERTKGQQRGLKCSPCCCQVMDVQASSLRCDDT
jgi:hypothetical protein